MRLLLKWDPCSSEDLLLESTPWMILLRCKVAWIINLSTCRILKINSLDKNRCKELTNSKLPNLRPKSSESTSLTNLPQLILQVTALMVFVLFKNAQMVFVNHTRRANKTDKLSMNHLLRPKPWLMRPKPRMLRRTSLLQPTPKRSNLNKKKQLKPRDKSTVSRELLLIPMEISCQLKPHKTPKKYLSIQPKRLMLLRKPRSKRMWPPTLPLNLILLRTLLSRQTFLPWLIWLPISRLTLLLPWMSLATTLRMLLLT